MGKRIISRKIYVAFRIVISVQINEDVFTSKRDSILPNDVAERYISEA